MEIVRGLGEGPDVMEVPVDGIGRFEVYQGRVRVTLTRVIERNGERRETPCLTLVWSAPAWLNAYSTAKLINEALTTGDGGYFEILAVH